jgi:hypothetical protein
MITTKKNEQLSQAPVIGSPKFIPILFSTEMVKAILSGSKTQTRRKLKKQPDLTKHSHISRGVVLDGKNRETFMFCTGSSNVVENIFCPYGQPGDVLWVRETWNKADNFPTDDNIFLYKETHVSKKRVSAIVWKWKPSIFMPKEACRIFLKVKSVRVERLNDISHEDSIAEGIEIIHNAEPTVNVFQRYDLKEKLGTTNPIYSYQTLWQKINGKDSWKENPFVWVIDFERTERPTGFL